MHFSGFARTVGTSLSLCLVVIGCLFSVASATLTFYVSPLGNDTNSGTSPDAPWQTLNAAGSRVSALNTSWTLLLARNHTWRNDLLTINATLATGAIEVGDYGNASLPQPYILGMRIMNGGASCVNIVGLSSASQLTLHHLHVSGCPVGIALDPLPGEVVANPLISHCAFLDIRTPYMQYSPPNPNWAVAILLVSGQFRSVTVRNNLAARIDTFFVSNAYVATFSLDSNTVQQCSGNCYSFGSGVDLTMSNSVMLRDNSNRLFMYGTTDVIVGGLMGYNALLNNDFNQRGEYEGGPDGCAFDFETGATGFLVRGNTFYRSWGSGVMIFGHATTSHNISLDSNVFAYDGCVQVRPDRGGIAVMCPNGQIPSGTLQNNIFFTCPDVPALYVNPSVPGCADNLTLINNTINGSTPMVPMPQVSMNPPDPACTDLAGTYNVVGVVPGYPFATIRYTLDGSRPTEASPILLPLVGLNIPWPGPVTVINMRGFQDGMISSVTNGVVLEVNYVMCRSAPIANAGPNGVSVSYLRGNLDGVNVINRSTSEVAVSGWVVDPLLPNEGWGPVVATFVVDYVTVGAVLATVYRPDLPLAGVAPNPDHGFDYVLPTPAAALLLSRGRHLLQVMAVGSPNAAAPTPLPEHFQQWMCDGIPC